jgi:hypothetical protein
MEFFDFDRRAVGKYSDFARSFTKMRSADIRARIDEPRWCWYSTMKVRP